MKLPRTFMCPEKSVKVTSFSHNSDHRSSWPIPQFPIPHLASPSTHIPLSDRLSWFHDAPVNDQWLDGCMEQAKHGVGGKVGLFVGGCHRMVTCYSKPPSRHDLYAYTNHQNTGLISVDRRTSLLSYVQYPVPYQSRLQRIYCSSCPNGE